MLNNSFCFFHLNDPLCFFLDFHDIYTIHVFGIPFNLNYTLCAFQSITKAYGRVDPDGSRYLLGDHTGLLSLLVITHEKEKYVVSHSRFSFGLNRFITV